MQASITSLPVKQQEQVLALRRYIAIFALLISITGITLFGLSFYKGSFNWMVTGIGSMYFLLGLFGIYAGLTLRLSVAKVYVVAIFACLVICMILLALELNLLNSWVNSICSAKSFTAIVCAQYRHFRWILAVISFVVAMPACCSCMFCAYSFQIALQPPRGRNYDYNFVSEPSEAPSSALLVAPTDPTSDL